MSKQYIPYELLSADQKAVLLNVVTEMFRQANEMSAAQKELLLERSIRILKPELSAVASELYGIRYANMIRFIAYTATGFDRRTTPEELIVLKTINRLADDGEVSDEEISLYARKGILSAESAFAKLQKISRSLSPQMRGIFCEFIILICTYDGAINLNEEDAVTHLFAP